MDAIEILVTKCDETRDANACQSLLNAIYYLKTGIYPFDHSHPGIATTGEKYRSPNFRARKAVAHA